MQGRKKKSVGCINFCTRSRSTTSSKMSEPTTKRARTDAPVDNPYLAHLNEPHQRMTGGANGGSAPFDGWIARKVDGKQVENAMVSPDELRRRRGGSESCTQIKSFRRLRLDSGPMSERPY